MIPRRLRALPASVLLLAALLAPAAARAQPAEAAALGAAQAIFDSAEKLMAARQYGQACPKLEEVVRLVPSGVGAKMTLAKCYDEAGRLASAWGAYVVAENAASTAGQADRAKAARDRAAALKPRLSTLTLTVPDGLRGVAGLEIKRDGIAMSQAEWGVAVPVDGGPHAITASAPKKKPWQGSVEVKGEASSASIVLPTQLEAAPDLAAPDAASAPADVGSARKVGGIAALSVGGALVALGAVMLALELTTTCDPNSDINFCMPPPPTPPYGIIAAVGLGVGGAGVVTGIVLLATAPKAPSRAAIVPLLGPGYVGVRGRF